jgi:hypothetical protein
MLKELIVESVKLSKMQVYTSLSLSGEVMKIA